MKHSTRAPAPPDTSGALRKPVIHEGRPWIDPAAAYEAVRGLPFSFFLDSGMDPARLGRYSFMGADPFLVLRSRGEEVSLIRDGDMERRRGNPFDIAGELLETYALDGGPAPVPFTGGAVGYFSYDLCH